MSKLQNILAVLESGVKPTVTWSFFDFENFDENDSLLVSALDVFHFLDFPVDTWIDIKVGDLKLSASTLYHCSLYTINSDVNVISFHPNDHSPWSQLIDSDEYHPLDDSADGYHLFPKVMNFIETHHAEMLLPTAAHINDQDKMYVQDVVKRLLVAC